MEKDNKYGEDYIMFIDSTKFDISGASVQNKYFYNYNSGGELQEKNSYDSVPESVLDKIRDIGPEDLKKDTEEKNSYDSVPESVLDKIRDIGPNDLKKKNIFEKFIDLIKSLFHKDK